MSLDVLVGLGVIAVAYWAIRSVMEPGSDLIEQARKAAERLGEEMRNPSRTTAPGPGPRPGVRTPVSRQPAARKSSPPKYSIRPASGREVTLQDWYFVLDVSPNADRREIQEALKRRLARARANRDGEAMRRAIQAAAAGIRAPRDAGHGEERGKRGDRV